MNNNLRKAREKKNLTPTDLARRAKVALSTVHRIEDGQWPTEATAKKLADAMGCGVTVQFK